jgi:hypothetical protein
MKFKVRESSGAPINAGGTSLIGQINTTYKRLVEVFGYPDNGDGYKTDAEWTLWFEDGTIATIYNYKDGKNYKGSDGLKVKDITDWHIGGHSPIAEKRVKDALKGESMKSFVMDIRVNENKLKKNYPNYKLNFSNTDEFIKFLLANIMGENSSKNGYSISITPIHNK